jgi:hypothetical protein
MPVSRYRDIADVPEPPRARTALEGLAAACAASELSSAFGHTHRAPRGVRKFRSIEEADAHRRAWESGGEIPPADSNVPVRADDDECPEH